MAKNRIHKTREELLHELNYTAKCRRNSSGFQLQRDFLKMVKRFLFGMNTSDTVTTIACIRPMG